MNTLYFSEILRYNILKEKNLYDELKKYFWDEEFKLLLLSINIDKDIEPELSNFTLHDIFIHGLNYGRCGLTCRYLIRLFDMLHPNQKMKIKSATYHVGTCELLIGTKSSPRGEHAFIEYNNYIYCPTLMLKLPKDIALEMGYKIKQTLAYDSARMLSEYECYTHSLKKIISFIQK